MRRAVLAALTGHWRRHPGQLLTLVLGLALGTALWSGVQAINAEARASYARAAQALGADRLDRLVDPAGGDIDQSVFVALRRAGVAVSPLLEGEVRTGETRLRLQGIEPLTAPPPLQVIDLTDPTDLEAFFDGAAYAGPEAVAAAQAAGLARVRVAASLAPGQVVMDIGAAQRVLNRPGAITALVMTSDMRPDPAVLDRLAPGLVRQSADGRADMAALTDSFHLNLTAFGLLSFAVGLFIAHGAVGLAFEQRMGLFRTLRALGVPARGVAQVYAVEVGTLAVLSAVIGLGLGYAVAAALMPDVAGTLRGLYGADLAGSLRLRPGWVLAGLAMTATGAGLSAAQGVWRLVRLPALATARPQAWRARAGRLLRMQAGLAGALMLAAAGLAATAGTVVMGFAAIGALFVGAALALPPLIAPVLAAAERGARAPVARWFWADARAQLSGLALALMALLLALAANIGVGTMVTSFRTTFDGWLDQRLMSELYVTARSEDEAARLRAYLRPRVDAVLPIRSVDLTDRPAGVEVFGVADHPTYRDHWPLLDAVPGAWGAIAAGQGVLVNEQMYRRQGLALGGAVALPGGALPIVGIYSDYGNPRAQVMLGLAAFEARFPKAPNLRFALRLPADRVAALMEDLHLRFGLPETAMIDQASVKRLSKQIFERTFAVTGALNVLTLGVAGVAIWTSLLTLATQRRAQVAPVWAMGIARGRIALLDLGRSAMLAALTFVLAVPLGLVLGWMLLDIVNVAAFGWRLPMRVFPGDWLRLGGLALIAAALATVLPARALARTRPADMLKVFAHDR